MTPIDLLQWSSSCLVYNVEIQKVVGCLLVLKAVQTLQLCFFPYATLRGPLCLIDDNLEPLSNTYLSSYWISNIVSRTPQHHEWVDRLYLISRERLLRGKVRLLIQWMILLPQGMAFNKEFLPLRARIDT